MWVRNRPNLFYNKLNVISLCNNTYEYTIHVYIVLLHKPSNKGNLNAVGSNYLQINNCIYLWRPQFVTKPTTPFNKIE